MQHPILLHEQIVPEHSGTSFVSDGGQNTDLDGVVLMALLYETNRSGDVKARKPDIEIIGPAAIHNQACAVLHQLGESAVLNMSMDAFEPSWRAQEQGFHLVFANTAFKRWIVRTFLK